MVMATIAGRVTLDPLLVPSELERDNILGCLALRVLYRVPEILTLGRFPDARESDSTWRTQEVRHVGSDTIAPRLWCVPAAWFGEEDERRPSGPSASGARRNL